MEEQDGGAVALAQAGDSEAFRQLVERHGRNVFRLAFRITGNEQDAEDVVQETFLRAYRQLNKYEARSSFGTWIHRIASNYALDLIRSRKRRSEHIASTSADNQMELIGAVAEPSPGPDRLASSVQMQQRIHAAMDDLSPQERTAFVLRHFEGQSIEEIGATLGTGVNATKHSIFRAVQKLRRSLEPLVSVPR